ncbi:Uncharacterised protein [uncultured archaeon]|nr:Uncharacterised protein [uncultured archaeon]
MIDAGWPDTPPEFQSILNRRLVQLQDVKHLPVTLYIRTMQVLAKEMKQKGVVLVVNGKPAILYSEAALVNEARRILTSKSALEIISN